MAKSIHHYQKLDCVSDNSLMTATYCPEDAVFHLKSVLVSSSCGPCKIVVSEFGKQNPVAVAFYTGSNPFVTINFSLPVSTKSGIGVMVTNNAGYAQDIYVTIIGAETTGFETFNC